MGGEETRGASQQCSGTTFDSCDTQTCCKAGGHCVHLRQATRNPLLSYGRGSRFLTDYSRPSGTFWTPKFDSGWPDGSSWMSRELWSSFGTLVWIIFARSVKDSQCFCNFNFQKSPSQSLDFLYNNFLCVV